MARRSKRQVRADLVRVVTKITRMSAADARALEQVLFDNSVIAWQTEMKQQGLKYTGQIIDVPRPGQSDLDVLRALARKDAKGIISTFNSDLKRQITNLVDSDPRVRGNRFAYRKRIRAWATKRSQWKDVSIALNTEMRTRQIAKERFWTENKLLSKSRFKFTGPTPPVCDICVRMFARGVVTIRTVRKNRVPLHPGCPHQWEVIRVIPLDLETMWVG